MICRGSFMTSSGRFRPRRRDGSSRRAIQNGSDDSPPGMASATSFASGSRAALATRTSAGNGRYARSSIFSTPTRFAEGLWTPPPSGRGPVHATGQAWTEFSCKWTRSRIEQHTAGQDRPWHTLVLPLAFTQLNAVLCVLGVLCVQSRCRLSLPNRLPFSAFSLCPLRTLRSRPLSSCRLLEL